MKKQKYILTFQHRLSRDEVEREIHKRTSLGKYLKEAEEIE